jgi:hypothetical protein
MKKWIKNNIEILMFWIIILYYIPNIWYNYIHSLPNPDMNDEIKSFFNQNQETKIINHVKKSKILYKDIDYLEVK